MKNTLPSFAFALLLAASLAPPSMVAQGNSPLEDQLRRQYVGSERMMRTFYAEDHLKFDAQGKLNGKSLTGPWTVFGRVTIDQLQLQTGKLRMEGHRQPVVFVEASKEWKRIPWKGTWTMEVSTRPGPEQAGQLESALQKIFLSASEDPASVMPDYWRDFMHRLSGQPVPGEPCEDSVSQTSKAAQPGAPLQLSEGVVDGMKVENAAPVYLGYAQYNKVEGEVRMRAVISTTGEVTRLCLTRVVGAGLDDEVARAVRLWKYRPYQLNGIPIEIKTSFTVRFHLQSR